MAFYRKKQVITAIQWNGTNFDELSEYVGKDLSKNEFSEELIIHTLEGDMKTSKGDFIIKGVKGEFYPCKPDIFDATYEKI